MKQSLRICSLLIVILFIAAALGTQTYSHVAAQPIPIQITDVEVPSEVAQSTRGQVKATIINPQNLTHKGFAKFSDNLGEIISHSPSDPFISTLNFTIGPESQLEITLDYSVADNATIGVHIATFEIAVGGFSFLFEQYEIVVTPVATITAVAPGHVFLQGSVGSLIITIENHVDRPRLVQLEVFGPKFSNTTRDVELTPGQNNIVLPLVHNVTHVYDFGMSLVNVSMYYADELIGSEVILVPVDMTLVNKLLAIIIPVTIFLLLVFIYAFRKRQRIRASTRSE